MKKLRLSLYFLSVCSVTSYAQSTVPVDYEPVRTTNSKQMIFDQSVANTVQNIGEKVEHGHLQNKPIYPVIDNSIESSVFSAQKISPNMQPIQYSPLLEKKYVRNSKLDIPQNFSNGPQEIYQRKTSQDIPVDFLNGVAEVYFRKEAMNSKEPKIQNEKSTAVDENSSVYSAPVKISSKPSAVNESRASSITNEPSNRISAINNPTRPTPSGKSSID